MTPMMRAFRLIFAADRWAMTRGALAAIAVLLMGAALLGLSGWFITATGMAGAAGIGIAFDVFRPSAGVRLLALGRAGTRYAERLLTHDATLRALTRLRVAILKRQELVPLPVLRQMRGAQQLTRITADVDALDGLALRLVLPVLAGLVTHALSFALLWHLTTPAIAASIALGYGLGGGLILTRSARRALAPSSRAEEHLQTYARQTIGMMRGQQEALMQGRLPAHLSALHSTETALRAEQAMLDRIDRRTGLALMALTSAIAALALTLPLSPLQTGDLDPARAAIGLFAALALVETLMPLRRGVSELGRMRTAANRLLSDPAQTRPADPPKPQPATPGLRAQNLTLPRPGTSQPLLRGITFTVQPGQTVALTGPSGLGKSTLLEALAGISPTAGEILIHGQPIQSWPRTDLRRALTLLPQRSALVSGTIRENLALAMPTPDDDSMWQALSAAQLTDTLTPRGGLDMPLGEGGAGLSGGETRRLALARALLRRPDILLLDEPTEGLDDATARAVLAGIRRLLPQTAILTASHRQAELDSADQVIDLQRYIDDIS